MNKKISFTDRVKFALKAFSYSTTGSQAQYGIDAFFLPGSHMDYQSEAGELIKNSIIASSVGWAVRTFPESELYIKNKNKLNEWESTYDHELLDLLASPHPDIDTNLLWSTTLASYMLNGNAYWLKIRSNSGKVVQLFPITFDEIEPRWKADGSEWLSAYTYLVDGKEYLIPKEDVVPFIFPIRDPENKRKGFSPIRSLLREIATDNLAANFTAALVRNFGQPSCNISPKNPGDSLSPDEAKMLLKIWNQKTSGEHVGDPFIATKPIDITPSGFNLEELMIDKIRQIPEERISSAFGIPAVVIGLGAGLSRSTYANMEEASREAYEQFIIPTQRAFCRAVNNYLLPEFGNNKTEKLAFDNSEVQSLQEDEGLKVDRAIKLFVNNVVKRSRAKEIVGEKADSNDEVYFVDVQGGALPQQKSIILKRLAAERMENGNTDSNDLE